jgi:hypothetical protein
MPVHSWVTVFVIWYAKFAGLPDLRSIPLVELVALNFIVLVNMSAPPAEETALPWFFWRAEIDSLSGRRVLSRWLMRSTPRTAPPDNVDPDYLKYVLVCSCFSLFVTHGLCFTLS